MLYTPLMHKQLVDQFGVVRYHWQNMRIAGECKISNEGKLQVEGKPKAQLQANLFALAGLLAEQAMKSDVVFDEICVYGICCFYQDEKGFLITLRLNFHDRFLKSNFSL